MQKCIDVTTKNYLNKYPELDLTRLYWWFFVNLDLKFNIKPLSLAYKIKVETNMDYGTLDYM